MNAEELRSIQRVLKARYHQAPKTTLIAWHALSHLGEEIASHSPALSVTR